jgi:hypothetical protein
MMERDCQNIFAALSQYLDEELPIESCEELEQHIQDCKPCVEFVESLKKSIALGRGYQPDVNAPEISPEVKAALREAYSKALSHK